MLGVRIGQNLGDKIRLSSSSIIDQAVGSDQEYNHRTLDFFAP